MPINLFIIILEITLAREKHFNKPWLANESTRSNFGAQTLFLDAKTFVYAIH